MRVLVCGGRDFTDRDRLFAELDQIHQENGITLLIHGEARGADRLADEWAAARSVWVAPFPADWKAFGRAAGPMRNRIMLTKGEPDMIVAFPGGRGTADMVKQATKAGVSVRHVPAHTLRTS